MRNVNYIKLRKKKKERKERKGQQLSLMPTTSCAHVGGGVAVAWAGIQVPDLSPLVALHQYMAGAAPEHTTPF